MCLDLYQFIQKRKYICIILNRFVLILFSFISSPVLYADAIAYDLPGSKSCVAIPFDYSTNMIEEAVKENFPFYGFASFYNRVGHYIVGLNSIEKMPERDPVVLRDEQWLAVVGRFDVILLKASGLTINLIGTRLSIVNPDVLASHGARAIKVNKLCLDAISPELDQIRYVHLWGPLAALTKLVEAALTWINARFTSNWGWTIFVFAVLLKILLLPVSIVTLRFQRQVNQIQTRLAPQLEEIGTNYKGEEAHNQVMAAYKAMGVSPFFTLKPMLGMFIQIPVLVAVFNALGEMPQLVGQSFLWIDDLAYPDVLGQLGSSIPMLGSTISLLPFLMTVVTVFSTATYRNPHAPYKEVCRQKRNLYVMALAFFFLFYPFPAAMLLYWSIVNILHAVQQQSIKS